MDWLLHPTPLEGRLVRLEPLRAEQAGSLFAIAQDEEIWRYLPVEMPRSLEEMQSWVAATLHGATDGGSIPFVVIHRPTGAVAGSSRYLAVDIANRVISIGWTWYGRAYWRSGVNTESKYLLLRQAFEVLGFNRVQIRTDLRNTRSQDAIARLGAVREGVLREDMIVKGGYKRSSVYFSILASEWPAVKARLDALMERAGASG